MNQPADAVPQNMAALEQANQTKQERKRIGAQIRAMNADDGREAMARLFLAAPPCIGSMYPRDVLKWVHRIYGSEIRQLLELSGATEYRAFGDLTPRQRGTISLGLRLHLNSTDFRSAMSVRVERRHRYLLALSERDYRIDDA